MANNTYYNAFQQMGQVMDDQTDLPLLPLSSKFSVTSQMNPVRGLEMKRLISVNPEGTAEPLIDLGNQGYINYFSNAPGLANQQSFFLDLNNQQSNINLFPNQYNQQSMLNDVYMQNNQSFMDPNIQISNAIQGNQRQNQNYYTQPQNFFVNPNAQNNNAQNSNQPQQQIQNQNLNNSNLIFKNPDQIGNHVSNYNNNGMKYTGQNLTNNGNNNGINHFGGNHINNQYNFQGNLQKQQQNGGIVYNDFQEKKEEIEQDGQNQGYDQFQVPKNQYYGQAQGIQQHPVINFQNLDKHQAYINRGEAEYIPEHESHHGDGSNNQYNQRGQNEQRYQEDDDDGYTGNMDSHTRHKTEWPSRPKGQTKYQQCRHRNIFKNFGNIFRKFVSFHNHFTDKALANLNNNQETLKNFQRWLKKEIRLENKKDFIEGWTIWKDEDHQIRQFKIILKELSRDFFQDYILIYLLNSKLQDLEIHLRSIGPCLAAINQPSILYKFRPI